MNTTELVNEIARRSKTTHSPLTRKQVSYMMDTLIVLMTETLYLEGGEVRLRGIGILQTKQRQMPNTQQLSNIHDTSDTFRYVQFRISDPLRQKINCPQ